MDVTEPINTPLAAPSNDAGEPPLLPRSQLIAISIYWFGINAMWGGYESSASTASLLLIPVKPRIEPPSPQPLAV